jgi:hypothetical protein
MEEAKKVAKAERVAVNQLINVAVAEKVSALRTEEYFAERAAKGDTKKAFQLLRRAATGNLKGLAVECHAVCHAEDEGLRRATIE